MGDETVTLWRPGIPYQKWLMMQQDLITEQEKQQWREQKAPQSAKPAAKKDTTTAKQIKLMP